MRLSACRRGITAPLALMYLDEFGWFSNPHAGRQSEAYRQPPERCLTMFTPSDVRQGNGTADARCRPSHKSVPVTAYFYNWYAAWSLLDAACQRGRYFAPEVRNANPSDK
ncbi:hypothetical protein KCP73_19245 [Salmonella enterica subsp. enterica]|nr:hypothetical protein KCP73_19245 [Salmonella enterica subsp. enterica]